ncbi:alpha/beta hydrolase [Rhodobacteraceae bacterium 2376]|uniref:Alpha/beta hydrolase n=1 Tax=Rhabdonatronobacter sediminivivens TaxID=2743469 RepID=A0A7Z0HZA1_9RHOB|nr:alpha/beta fold hydrolase [Rhabdonatronobacter sediminivivens]NYS25036.1 alpha/beta hydrolase [Rhabdonatronobacter sediminivivens]
MTRPTEAPLFHTIAEAPPGGQARWLVARDGIRLRMAHWPGAGAGLVMVFPGRTEVIEKYGRVIADLVAAGHSVSAIDWRGQGLSDRLTGDPLLGYVNNFSDFQADVDVWHDALRDLDPAAEQPLVLAHSMGGCIALRALTRGLRARAVAFSAPMWGLRAGKFMRLGMAGLARAARITGRDAIPVPGAGIEFRLWDNPFDNNDLTTDPDTYAWMQHQVNAHPELRLGAPSLRWLGAALAETAALARLPAPDVPAWCGLGTRERIVSAEAIETRMQGWPGGQLEVFDGAEHELLMEAPAHRTRFLTATLAHFAAN